MTQGRTITMTIIGAVFVVVGAVLWWVDPSARPAATVGILFFGACVAIGVLELLKGRISRVTWARLMGTAALLMGLGCGALALVAWDDPTAFRRAPQLVSVVVGLTGLVFFGGGGLLLLIRGGRPFGVDRADYRRRNLR